MLQSIRRSLVVVRLPLPWVLSLATCLSFSWLLVQDQIHPLMVYLLQLYLTF
jgi:hypothetical protein